MREAPLLDAVQHRIVARRSIEFAPGRRALEFRKTPAFQIADKVCRGIRQPRAHLLHEGQW